MHARSPLRRSSAVLVSGIVSIVLVITACTSPPVFDRNAAVDNVVKDGGGRITRPQAECYVDRVIAELGPSALDRGTTPPVEQVSRRTGIRVDCVGINSLGTDPPNVAAPRSIDPVLGSEPTRFGDDPDLDELYTACGATGGSACDRLFDVAPLGTDYEEFASTCGGRTKELSCAARYPDVSTTTTTPPPSTTTTAVPVTTTTTKSGAKTTTTTAAKKR